MTFFNIGVVEDVNDPIMLGRVRIRIVGVHSDNLTDLPTSDLPWAEVISGVNDASISGIGDTPRLLPGTWVVCSFLDDFKQKPIIIGSMKGVPGGATNLSPTEQDTITEIVATTPPDNPPAPVVQKDPNTGKTQIIEPGYIGSLTNSQVITLKATIAQSESGGYDNPYAVENSIGYLGKYQFGAAFLKDQGYINSSAQGTNKTIVDNPANWTGKNGINNKNDFFANISLQESLMDTMLKNNYKIMARAGVLSEQVVPEKTAGLLMAAHLVGAGGAIKFVKGINSSDANGTTAAVYYNKGYACIIGKSTVEQPTLNNLSSPAIDKNLPVKNDATKYDPGKIVSSGKQGFQDPSGKYPLKNQLNEPDLNRLARGVNIANTIVGEKEANIVKNIPIANSSITWNQSPIPYAAVYPNNRVIASESGHILEFDDTPGAERINLHHTSGTFNEIDHQGNQVEKTVGIRTIIVEKDELVYIQGSGHVNLDGDLSLRVGGSCNIQVIGDANLNISGNCYQSISGDYNLKVGGSMKISTGGLASIQAGGNFAVDATSNLLNSGGSVAPISASPYNPTIIIPSPVNRKDVADFQLEGETDISAIVYQDAPQATLIGSDTTPQNKVTPVQSKCGFDSISPSTILSVNYTLDSLCKDGPFPYSNGQHGLTPDDLACNLKQLSINVIEPLRELYSNVGFRINSCFRPAGSSVSKSRKISQHELGQAVDIGFSMIRGQPNDKQQYYNIAQQIKNQVPFDQMLLEYRSNGNVWIHISFTSGNLRQEILTMYNDQTYGQGLILLS